MCFRFYRNAYANVCNHRHTTNYYYSACKCVTVKIRAPKQQRNVQGIPRGVYPHPHILSAEKNAQRTFLSINYTFADRARRAYSIILNVIQRRERPWWFACLCVAFSGEITHKLYGIYCLLVVSTVATTRRRPANTKPSRQLRPPSLPVSLSGRPCRRRRVFGLVVNHHKGAS